MTNSSEKRVKRVKQTIKTLARLSDTDLAKRLIYKCDPAVIRAISNASINALHGPVRLSRSDRRLFRQHLPTFEQLADRHIPIKDKRRIIADQSGGAFLPILLPLLASVIGSIGTAFISRFNAKKEGE